MDLREFPHTGNGNGNLPPISPTTYARDWSAYNESQTQEKALFTLLLHGLCEPLPALPQEAGRPRLPLSDMVFAATYKSYSTFSGRRFMTDLREACASGYISRAPHFNSIFNYLELPELTPILHGLITESALPLKTIETDFAIDSSGFTTSVFCGLWRSEKYGKDKQKIVHNWLKAHVMSGVRTNVVTSVEITPRNGADSPQFAPLLKDTVRNFDVRRVLADKAYSSHYNLGLAESLGVPPFIPFKSYSTAGKRSQTWNRLFHFYSMHQEEFYAAYHKRSNAESTFSAIKRKFGDFIRSKTPVAQVNELLCKFLAYNVCCVIRSMHELGIDPNC